MNSKQMDYVIEASETLNFNRAAENLFTSQPALSYQIKVVEEEIGFQIFERVGKSIRLTPAGKQFCQSLRSIRQQLSDAIEQGQNYSSQYKDNLTVAFPMRSMLANLPEAIQQFHETFPEVLVTPEIGSPRALEDFVEGTIDVLFLSKKDLRHFPDGQVHALYEAPIYLLVAADDPLAEKEKATPADLEGRTLLVNGGSSLALKELQQSLVTQGKVKTLNSPTHDFTMVTVASGQAVCLSPGYLMAPDEQVVWLPFETDLVYDCYLLTHKEDQRPALQELISLLQATAMEFD